MYNHTCLASQDLDTILPQGCILFSVAYTPRSSAFLCKVKALDSRPQDERNPSSTSQDTCGFEIFKSFKRNNNCTKA